MPILPIPNRCIWCLKEPSEVQFDVSHVLPRCLGNDKQQILPSGVVCKGCNNFFGRKVEPVLLADPLFHTRAAALRLIDPNDGNAFRDKIFDAEHQATDVRRHLHMDLVVHDTEMDLGVTYTISGRLKQTYAPRKLKWLSRAVHKMAFETLAWALFVKGVDNPVDVFAKSFDAVRTWGRYGYPQASVRPVLRHLGHEVGVKWEPVIRTVGEEFFVQLLLFGDWYAVNITAPPTEALTELRRWLGDNTDSIWCVSNKLAMLDQM
jgi:hypothetical protein